MAIVNCDAKSLEWITYLFLSQDKVGIQEWLEFVADPKLNDIHTKNQKDLLLPSRLVSKIFLFRCIYRGPAYAYANDADFAGTSKSEKFWQRVIDNFFEKYAGLNKKHIEYINTAIRTGTLVTPFGREFTFTPTKLKNGGQKWNESDITNWPNQGTGADVMAVARVVFARKFRAHHCMGNLVSTVHDSIVADVPDEWVKPTARLMYETFSELPAAITRAYGVEWNLPLLCEVGVGDNMKDLTELKHIDTM